MIYSVTFYNTFCNICIYIWYALYEIVCESAGNSSAASCDAMCALAALVPYYW